MTQSVWTWCQVAQVVKDLPANAGDVRDAGSIPGLGRSPRGGHGNALQYSCLENPHVQRSLASYSPGVTKNQTQQSNFSSFKSQFLNCIYFWLC